MQMSEHKNEHMKRLTLAKSSEKLRSVSGTKTLKLAKDSKELRSVSVKRTTNRHDEDRGSSSPVEESLDRKV